MKVSIETRDRIKSFGGATLEETIVEALDALDEQRFWAQAERAAAWRATLSEAGSLTRCRIRGAFGSTAASSPWIECGPSPRTDSSTIWVARRLAR